MENCADLHLYLYGPDRGPIESSFEEAESRLVALPQLHFEPDGSFVWTGNAGQQQVFGMIYDAAGSIQYCELRGHCDLNGWRTLCNAITGQRPSRLEVLALGERKWQDLQSFEQSEWPNSDPNQNLS